MGIKKHTISFQIIFFILFFLEVFPVWYFTYFPTHDGPAHIYNSYVLKSFFTEMPPRLDEYFKLNALPFPNWASHPFMATLMLIFSPLVAHKIFLTFIIILFPLSIFYFLESVKQGTSIYVLLGFLFNYHFMLHIGFYNFALSAPFYFFTVGYFWKHKGNFDIKKIMVLTFLFLATYFCHMITFVLLMLSVTLLVCTSQYRNPERLLRYLAGLVPFYLIMVIFILQFTIGEQKEYFTTRHWLGYFFDIRSLVYHTNTHLFITRSLIVMIAILFIVTIYRITYKKKTARSEYHFLILALFLTGLYFVLPGRLASGAMLNDRVHFFIFLVLLPFLHEDFSKAVRSMLVALMILLCIGHIAISYRYYYILNKGLQEFTSGRHLIENNKTILALSSDWWNYDETEVHYLEPFVQAANYYCLGTGGVNLGNYEAQFDYFPINWKKKHTGKIDYVIAWKLENDITLSTDAEGGTVHKIDLLALRRSLDSEYDLIYSSGKNLKLYRHKSLAHQGR